jgi:hypothetical protein
MDRVENTVSKSTSIVSHRFVAAGTCLPCRCLEAALVYLFISRSLHSNSSTRYNNMHYIFEHFVMRDEEQSKKINAYQRMLSVGQVLQIYAYGGRPTFHDP